MVYDCSSFTAGGSEEFYMQSETSNNFVPMTRSKQVVDQKNVQLVVKMRQMLTEKQIEEDPDDKVMRKTRKRKQGTLTN